MSFPLKRHFTKAGAAPLAQIQWKLLTIPGWDRPVEAPESWSDSAVEIVANRYFRRRDGEFSVRQMVARVVNSIRQSGEQQGYF